MQYIEAQKVKNNWVFCLKDKLWVSWSLFWFWIIFTYPLGTYVIVSVVWFPRSIKKCNLGLSAITSKRTCHSCVPCSGPAANSAPTLHIAFPVPSGHRSKIHQNDSTSITTVLSTVPKSHHLCSHFKVQEYWKQNQSGKRHKFSNGFLLSWNFMCLYRKC